MNDGNHDFDPRLAELFAREHTHLPAEPFATAALRAIAVERKRAALMTRLGQAAALTALIVTSPWLIDASTWVSARLDAVFASTSAWLSSPFGLAGAALCVLAALAAKWARIW